MTAGALGVDRPRRGRLLASLMGRPRLLAALIYAVLSVVMVAPGLMPGKTLSGSDYLYNDAPWQSVRPVSVPGLGANFELADAADVFQPFLQYTRSQLPSVPLWNPYISGGRPYLANTQSAVFSPFSLLAYVLPFWRSLAVIAALKLFIGALGAFALARALGMRLGGALLTGLVFAFGTFYVIWLAWPLTNIFPLIPWLLLVVDRIVKDPGPLPAAGLGALVALAYLGGHPETTFHTLFVATVFFCFRLWTSGRLTRARWRGLPSPLGAFAFAMVAGSLVAAVVFIPFAELLAHSSDLTRRSANGPDHWPAKYLGALLLHDYWGRATQQSNLEPFMQLRGWYAGAVTLMLTAAALIIRPTRLRVGLAVFAAFVVCLVVGVPPVWQIVVSLPGFSSAHNERMLIDFLLCVALLAGFGLDEITDARLSASRRRAVLWTGMVIFLSPFAWMIARQTLTTHGLLTALKVAWGFAHPPTLPSGSVDLGTTPQAGIIRMSALLQWIPLAGIGLALIAARLRPAARRLGPAAFVIAALVLVATDLFRANMGFNPAIPIRNAEQPTTGAIRYLQSQRPNRFVGVSTNISFQPLPADTAMTYRIYDARGYDYPAESRYNTLWRRNVAPGVPDFAQPIETAADTPAALAGLDLLSVSDLLVDPHQPPQRRPGLSVAYRGSDAVVYRNADALPRVFTVDQQHTVHSAASALALSAATGFDRRRVIVTERPIPGLPQAPSSSAGRRGGAGSGQARLVSYAAQRVVATATVSRPSVFVLTDVFFPGWTVTVDGRAASVTRVDYLLRGVRIGPGRHRIVFTYRPASGRIGALLSVVGLLALLGAAIVGWRRRRREPAGA